MTLLYQTAVRAHRRRRILRTRTRPLSLFRNGADNGMRRQALTAIRPVTARCADSLSSDGQVRGFSALVQPALHESSAANRQTADRPED
jgi:hypothetical protein